MNPATLIRTLEENGIDRKAAEALATAITAREARDTAAVPQWAIAVAVLAAGAIGWLAVEIRDNRTEIARTRTELTAAMADTGKSLARLETLLAERLPPRPTPGTT